MPIVDATNLACPLDGLPLTGNGRQFTCPNGHCFDIARPAYVNLLPVQHKRSKHPGDSEEMIRARAAFLEGGVYTPIADQLSTITHELISNSLDTDVCLLDAGCGEGYYLTHWLASLQLTPIQRNIALIGLDISKPAILAAARRNREITWLIASNRQPPIAPGTVDVVFCLFGFPVYDSFRLLLKPRGKIILVEAGPEHLVELRSIVYPTVNKAPPPDLAAALAAGFSLYQQSNLTYRRKIDSNAQILNLLHMTPHYYRASHAGKLAAAALDAIEITVDVVFRVLVRA